MEEEVKYKIVNKSNKNIVEPSETEQKVLNAMATYLASRNLFCGHENDGRVFTPSPGLTEDMLLSLTLQSERLRKLDINMEAHEEWLVSMGGIKRFSKQPEFIYDGGNLVGHLRKQMKSVVTYYKKPHYKWGPGTSFWDNIQKDYYFKEAENGSFQITAEDVLLQSEEYNRSCDYWDEKKWNREKLGIGFSLFALGFFGLIHLSSYVVFILCVLGKLDYMALGLSLMLWLSSVGGVFPLVLYDYKKITSYKYRRASIRVLQNIRLTISDFCMNDFVSMAQNRIKSIFYAERMEHVAQFVNFDVHPFLLRHAYVINCETLNFWFQDFGQDGENQYIDIKQMLRLTNKEQGNQVKRNILYVKVRFTRPINGIMTEDWYIENMEVLKWKKN
ncbi:MAG: hypothetical protein IKK33_02860 [Lachnospiraceae bacterium]|nr:hypothetical protein [Lachnospiraceae bacterium]